MKNLRLVKLLGQELVKFLDPIVVGHIDPVFIFRAEYLKRSQ